MNLFILASTILLAIAIAIANKKSDSDVEKQKEDFFEREHKANFVRKKSLDNLKYISIPEEFLSYDYKKAFKNCKNEENALKAVDTLISLKEEKIVNFTGKTNTDLKLEYGTANINILSEFDQNYTLLVTSLQTICESMIEADEDFTIKMLEYAINIGTDISLSYKMLIDIYVSKNDENLLASKKEVLTEKAKALNSVMSPSIIRYIENAGKAINENDDTSEDESEDELKDE